MGAEQPQMTRKFEKVDIRHLPSHISGRNSDWFVSFRILFLATINIFEFFND
jgi:hypothetical protein